MTSLSKPEVIAVARRTPDRMREVDALAERCRRAETSLEVPVFWEPEENTHAILCYRAGGLVGFAGLSHDPLPEFLAMVDPDHRRGGIGSALFAAAKSECERRGADALLLVREQGSAGAEPFSRSVGGQYRFSEYCLQLDPALFSRTDTLPANTTIGAAGRADADALTAIRTAAFGGDAAHARSAIRTWLGAPNQRIFIARIRDEPIGMVRLQDLQDVAFINGLAVLPDRQRQGLGRALLQHAVAARLDEGETPIRLEVETENRGALALYLDCGFRETTTYHYDYCPV